MRGKGVEGVGRRGRGRRVELAVCVLVLEEGGGWKGGGSPGWRRIWGSIRGEGGGVVGVVALGFGEFGAGDFRYSKLSL